MKAGDIVTIEGKKYMAHNGDCGDCDCYSEDLPCPEGCSHCGEFLFSFNRFCDYWDEEKSECKIYSRVNTFVDWDGSFYTVQTPRDYCEGRFCPNYQVIEDNIQ